MNHCPPMLQCPVCAQILRRQDRAFRCPQGHSFDVARQGYVNLWLPHGKKPSILGDDAAMLKARRRFLDTGHHIPLSRAINHAVAQKMPLSAADENSLCILDVGCGEGYYLGRLARHLEHRSGGRACCFFGMDLSKQAVRLAAGRYKRVQFFVTDVHDRILLPDDTVDVLLNVFAPRNVPEFARVLSSNGRILIVIPGPDHLQDVRATYSLLEIEQGKEEKLVDTFSDAFRLRGRHVIRYERRLKGEDLADLIRMTPNYWHQEQINWNELENDEGRDVHFSFVILQFATTQEGTGDDSVRISA